MATDRQKAHASISYFLKRYEGIYGANPPGFNRYTLTYGFEAMNKDYPGMDRKIIDFFFDSYEEHNPQTLAYQYGKIVERIEDEEKDAEARREVRRRTQERMKIVTDSREGN